MACASVAGRRWKEALELLQAMRDGIQSMVERSSGACELQSPWAMQLRRAPRRWSPQRATHLRLLALASLQCGDATLALDACNTLLDSQPHDCVAWQYKADAFWSMGRVQEAARCLRSVARVLDVWWQHVIATTASGTDEGTSASGGGPRGKSAGKRPRDGMHVDGRAVKAARQDDAPCRHGPGRPQGPGQDVDAMRDEYAAPHNRGMASHVFVKELYVTVRGAWSPPFFTLAMAVHGSWLVVRVRLPQTLCNLGETIAAVEGSAAAIPVLRRCVRLATCRGQGVAGDALPDLLCLTVTYNLCLHLLATNQACVSRRVCLYLCPGLPCVR